MENNINFLTLSELSESIGAVLRDHFDSDSWVVAEVSEIKVNQSGHCYLELIQKAAGERMPLAVARGIIWNRSYKMISGYFRFQTGGDIAQGMKILVKCSVNYHPVYGLSLVISDIDPAYTLGEAERLRRETIAQLQQEGVFDMNRELELPVVVQRLAVISSANAAGYQDFMKELERSPYMFHTTLFRAVMQGAEAETSIVAALEAIAGCEEMFDAVVIIRGGGSQADLSCFDCYNIGANIAQFPLPVLTGIGHDKDVSVADMVANMSMKTPTAVAATLVEMAAEFAGLLQSLEGEVIGLAEDILTAQQRLIGNQALRLGQITLETIHSQQIYIAGVESRLVSESREVISGYKNRLENLAVWFSQSPVGTIQNNFGVLNLLKVRLGMAASDFIGGERQRLELALASVEGADPKKILRMGYAIVRSGDKVLTDYSKAGVGETVSIELHKGRLTAEIKSKSKK